jgi:hypothetical protein
MEPAGGAAVPLVERRYGLGAELGEAYGVRVREEPVSVRATSSQPLRLHWSYYTHTLSPYPAHAILFRDVVGRNHAKTPHPQPSERDNARPELGELVAKVFARACHEDERGGDLEVTRESRDSRGTEVRLHNDQVDGNLGKRLVEDLPVRFQL